MNAVDTIKQLLKDVSKDGLFESYEIDGEESVVVNLGKEKSIKIDYELLLFYVKIHRVDDAKEIIVQAIRESTLDLRGQGNSFEFIKDSIMQ